MLPCGRSRASSSRGGVPQALHSCINALNHPPEIEHKSGSQNVLIATLFVTKQHWNKRKSNTFAEQNHNYVPYR